MRGLCRLSSARISRRLPAIDLGRGALLEIVGADEQHHGRRVQRQHVVLEPDQHAARGVAADAAVGDLHARKGRAQASSQSCVIESPRKTTAPWSRSRLRRPRRAPLAPQVLEPVVAADRPGAGQAIVGRRDREPSAGGDRRRLRRRGRETGSEEVRRGKQRAAPGPIDVGHAWRIAQKAQRRRGAMPSVAVGDNPGRRRRARPRGRASAESCCPGAAAARDGRRRCCSRCCRSPSARAAARPADRRARGRTCRPA